MRLVKFMDANQIFALKRLDMIVLTEEQISVLNAYTCLSEKKKQCMLAMMERLVDEVPEVISADFGATYPAREQFRRRQ